MHINGHFYKKGECLKAQLQNIMCPNHVVIVKRYPIGLKLVKCLMKGEAVIIFFL